MPRVGRHTRGRGGWSGRSQAASGQGQYQSGMRCGCCWRYYGGGGGGVGCPPRAFPSPSPRAAPHATTGGMRTNAAAFLWGRARGTATCAPSPAAHVFSSLLCSSYAEHQRSGRRRRQSWRSRGALLPPPNLRARRGGDRQPRRGCIGPRSCHLGGLNRCRLHWQSLGWGRSPLVRAAEVACFSIYLTVFFVGKGRVALVGCT